MEIKKYHTAKNISPSWDASITSTYQSIAFLSHLETFNLCKQRYYVAQDSEKILAGAIVYSLKINLLTFSKFSFPITFTVIGIPASVDAAGIIGTNNEEIKALIEYIFSQEKGLIVCLNYNQIDNIAKIIKMQTLPTLIFEKKNDSWNDFFNAIKHNYRHRILKAEAKIATAEKRVEPCTCFTIEHYNQYLAILKKSKTKLETLSFEFFRNLPDNYQLFSFYHDNELLVWHISTFDNSVYYFLFGGINYELRDEFDSYYNNLISILKEGFETQCDTINLGQTAIVSKNRLGADIIPLKMFFYHANPIIRRILLLTKQLISYKIKENGVNIYKSLNYENTFYQTAHTGRNNRVAARNAR